MIDLDAVDRKLIAILRSNSRTPVVTLAKQLNVSRATVQNRLSRLEKNGVIINFTVNLKPGADINPVRAFMSISVEGKKSVIVIKALRGYPSIIALHHTNGRWDLIAEIRTDTLESFNALLGDIRLIDGVSSTETSLLLDTLRF
ncbi:MAG: Lrp/AsnC family transcriptional regulator [Gammaproteobacteria bacterium]|jgi:DNA-binding Lrp family transcriptional regulator|nr:Lrp/AsnC family transcriptional regulator [Gammaproteobacteria bacterium]MBT3725805.1 Lrp/AsnC family transcriptional regulator [Gammaproteobacteria bacterium]MBT4078553.1 Lrp/AsnC family transcriptional regulator [Gammaproteobacteria bacterium]MBT4193461.1 Lrp/AsnC family transcriptional regulator [Gammaproteobacteria bacterium]MBT4451975.1 Lrp/AsnC family transcriptional regulator [Gammaproteobacteria bacterium]